MSNNNKIVSFKLDASTFQSLLNSKNIKLDVKKNESVELMLPDTRIRLDAESRPNIKNATTAVYYNNKSTSLFFLGDATTAKATAIKREPPQKKPVSSTIKKDIPSPVIHASSPHSAKQSPLLKPSSTSSNQLKKPTINKSSSTSSKKATITTTTKSTTNNHIPARGSGATPSQNNTTPRPSTVTNPTASLEKLNDRVIQLLALRPYQVTTLAKLLDCTQWDIKKILDDVAILIPDPQKKKYCLKPQSYKHIRIFDWPSYTNEEKQTVIANTKEAFDMMKLPSDAPERFRLVDPSTPNYSKLLAAHRAKRNNPTKPAVVRKEIKVEKSSPLTEKGKGKTTPSGFSYSTPPPIRSTSTEPLVKSPIRTSQMMKPPASRPASTQPIIKSTKKSVESKALPIATEKISPPTKRKSDHETHSAPTSVHASVANKRIKAIEQSTAPIELFNITSQSMFDKYCNKFAATQKEYIHTKSNFKRKFPRYIQALEASKPMTGNKRSYFDLKLEYYEMVKLEYLKTEDEQSWEEAETQLNMCHEKRRRLNYMWSSIEKNITEHHYKLNYKPC